MSNLRVVLAAGAAAVALATGSTVALAAATDGFSGARAGAAYGPASRALASQALPATACTAPTLPGTVVDVTLVDMGGRMAGGMAYAGRTGMAGRGGWGAGMPGMMRIDVAPTSVPSGTVSLRVSNLGVREHEVVVLPLADADQPGGRPVGSDGRVSESGSLGEASATCASGEGDGIASGSRGWVTLTLAPGRYELVCNLPGHYAAGMFAELDVAA